ncbi:MAG: anti-sigma factor domain-containing protein [Clostridiaceae bacterium]|nr:anti-sigma factor domain-containing protein [Clostridiaceae bacterium]
MKILEFLRTKKFFVKNLSDFFKSKEFTPKQLSHFFGKKTTIQNEYYDSIIKIKQGDLLEKKDFTAKHKSFILETISHCLGRSTIPKNSPEYDIGLDAFHHAIDQFNPEKDKDFLQFSEEIIREWVLSYIKENKSTNVFEQIDEEKYYLYSNFESSRDISQFKRNLWEYGIKLNELPNLSPDEKQNIGLCVRIAKHLSKDDELFEKVANNKNLSLEDFNDGIKLERRLFNRHRKYIIALTLIIKNNLRILCSYLKNVNLRNDFTQNIGVVLEVKKDQAILFTLQGEFLTIKLSTASKVGEQLKFGSYRVQKKNRNSRFIVAAWVFTSILICIAMYNGIQMIMNADKPTVSYTADKTPEPESTSSSISIVVDETPQPATASTNTPTNTSNLLASEPSPGELPATNPNSNIVTQSPTPFQSNTTPTPSQTMLATPTTLITNATGVPGEARISVHPPKVKVGENYEVHFYMKSGNNGTTLILYQDEKEYTRYDLVDRTPRDQARIISINATEPGVYNYRWELINEFGASTSKTVTVTVSE